MSKGQLAYNEKSSKSWPIVSEAKWPFYVTEQGERKMLILAHWGGGWNRYWAELKICYPGALCEPAGLPTPPTSGPQAQVISTLLCEEAPVQLPQKRGGRSSSGSPVCMNQCYCAEVRCSHYNFCYAEALVHTKDDSTWTWSWPQTLLYMVTIMCESHVLEIWVRCQGKFLPHESRAVAAKSTTRARSSMPQLPVWTAASAWKSGCRTCWGKGSERSCLAWVWDWKWNKGAAAWKRKPPHCHTWTGNYDMQQATVWRALI